MKKIMFLAFALIMILAAGAQIFASEASPEKKLTQYLPNDETVIFILKYVPQRMLQIANGIFPMDPASWQKRFKWLAKEREEWQKGSDTSQEPQPAEKSKISGETPGKNQEPAKGPNPAKKMLNLISREVEDIVKNFYGTFKK
jgi:hypothetical protein